MKSLRTLDTCHINFNRFFLKGSGQYICIIPFLISSIGGKFLWKRLRALESYHNFLQVNLQEIPAEQATNMRHISHLFFTIMRKGNLNEKTTDTRDVAYDLAGRSLNGLESDAS